MFAANVPEKLIQSRTGHCSLEALRVYERPSHEKHQAVSNVLTSAESQWSFGDELTNIQSTAEPTTTLSMVGNCSLTKMTTVQSQCPPSWQVPSLFGIMNHCSVNINVNMNAPQRNQWKKSLTIWSPMYTSHINCILPLPAFGLLHCVLLLLV